MRIVNEKAEARVRRLDPVGIAVRYGLLTAFVVMCGFLAASRENFATGANVRTILLTSAVSFIVAVPLGMLLQSGGIDFSVGSTVGLSVVLGGRFLSDYGLDPLVAIAAVLGCTAVVGAVNGLLCARWRLSPVVVTIGMLFLLRGVAFVLSGADVRRDFGRSFPYLGRSRWVVLDIPAPVVLAAVWGAVLMTLWFRTRWGRHAHASGIDETAAISAGIDPRRSRFGMHVLTSVSAGIWVGVLFLSVLGNGLIQYRVDPDWTRIVQGSVLVASAGFQVLIVKAAGRHRVAAKSVGDGDARSGITESDPPQPRYVGSSDDTTRSSLVVKGLTKRFGAITALHDVSFSVNAGQVVALLGDNGAGKSTLVKTLTGLHQPDDGILELDGIAQRPASPAHAQALGIEAVQQGLGVVGLFSSAENLFLGREPSPPGPLKYLGWIDREVMRSKTAEELEGLHVSVHSVDAPIISLSGGQRQSIAVARASLWATSVVILDEPTAALGVEQSAELLRLVRRLADSGTAVILVTHDMPQVLAVCDKAVVLRHGRCIADEIVGVETDVTRLVGLVTGSVEGRFDAK